MHVSSSRSFVKEMTEGHKAPDDEKSYTLPGMGSRAIKDQQNSHETGKELQQEVKVEAEVEEQEGWEK